VKADSAARSRESLGYAARSRLSLYQMKRNVRSNVMAVQRVTQSPDDRASGHYASGESLGLLIARIAMGSIFLWSGFGKLSSLSQFTAGMVDRGLPSAQLLAPVGAAVEFAAAVALILGAGTRIAALALAVFTVVATMIAHRFWDFPADEQRMQSIQFMKNVAIIGGLAALIAVGGGRFSFDGMLHGPSFPARPLNKR